MASAMIFSRSEKVWFDRGGLNSSGGQDASSMVL